MAYISIEEVKDIRLKIKPILKELGYKGTIKRVHYSKVVLSLKEVGSISLAPEVYKKLYEAMKLESYYDNSDPMTDYFDTAYYIGVDVLS
jgi:hypothetical protein